MCICEETWGPAEGCYKAITPCGEFCVECEYDPTDGDAGTATCHECVGGFYVDDENKCQVCSDDCKTCSAETHCTACHDGFYEDSGDCLHCNANCKTCSGPDNNECLSCYDATESTSEISKEESMGA